MDVRAFGFGIAVLGVLMAGACATGPVAAGQAQSGAEAPAAKFEQDRKAILAMLGTYRVGFDFRETVAIEPGYALKPPKLSGGDEVVTLIADAGDFISLQHTLVVGPKDDPMVVKHWRQDWRYQPSEVLEFKGRDVFDVDDVPSDARMGAWSQVVYQVDDSPRYGGYGAWVHGPDASTWESNVSWRPLPRRDDTTRTDYQVIEATNRHTITAFGWTHEQDNSKSVLTEAGLRELVREVGVNTYRRSDAVNRKPVDDYWAKTAGLWTDVRAVWGKLEADGRAFTVADDAEGSSLYTPVLEVSDRLAAGEIDEATAVKEAVALIRKQTSGPASVALAGL